MLLQHVNTQDSAPAPAPAIAPQLALYLDTALPRALTRQLVELCRRQDSRLVILAPPPGDLAVSRIEPSLSALTRAGIEWEIVTVEGDPAVAVPELLRRRPAISMLVCDHRSALTHALYQGGARAPGKSPVPLLVMLIPEPELARGERAAPEREVDWLEPRFHRGF
jgi:hypothetical protein